MGNGDLVTDLSFGALTSTASVHSGDGQSSRRDDNANVRRRARTNENKKEDDNKSEDAENEDLTKTPTEAVTSSEHQLDSLA
jgi:hypothetical protein